MLFGILLQLLVLLVLGALDGSGELSDRTLQLLTLLLELSYLVVLGKEEVPFWSCARRSPPPAASRGLSNSRTGFYMPSSGCGINHVL